MTQLNDIINVAQNLVRAVSTLTETYFKLQGTQRAAAMTATTLVSGSQGRLVQVSVIVAGSASGAIYDSSNASSLTNQVAAIPNIIGVYNYNIPVTSGIVVAPGTGQTVCVTYS